MKSATLWKCLGCQAENSISDKKCKCGRPRELSDTAYAQRKPLIDLQEQAKEAINVAEEAARKFGPYASLHEAYAVMLEEVDELWQIVRQKQFVPIPSAHLENPVVYPMDLWPNHPGLKQWNARQEHRIAKEALDIAAVALRIAADAERLATK